MNINLKCEKCDVNCKTCTKSTNCDLCKDGIISN